MGVLNRLARPLLGCAFIASGIETLLDPGPMTHGAREVGLDRLTGLEAATMTRSAAAAQVTAGLLLATNRAPRLSALVLAGTVVPTTYAGHPFWTETDKQVRGRERAQFVKNLGLLGGLLASVSSGRSRRRAHRRKGHHLPLPTS